MKRITVPEPDITLYEDGFKKKNGDPLDRLGREDTGKKLSELVERIDEPLVIALDGAWGSGKSFFLKCWVGYHLQQEGHKAETVYFDAFKHDYLDDPLIALTGEIARRFRTEEDEAEDAKSAKKDARVKKLKKSAWAVGKAAGRIGLSTVTFGATEILGNMGDEIAKAASEEAKAFLDHAGGEDESEKYWNMHEAKIAAMEGFRLALESLTEPATEQQAAESEGRLKEGDPTRKLVIVVDELDRCRPDYALSLLEIIKHFFNVPGVHFVLGVNLKELQNSVRARYGSKTSAEIYLQRFYHLSLSLKNKLHRYDDASDYLKYFNKISREMEITGSPYFVLARRHIEHLQDYPNLNLRGIQHFSRLIATTPYLDYDPYGYSNYLVVGLLFLKTFDPEAAESIREGTLSWRHLQRIFRPQVPWETSGFLKKFSTAWLLCYQDQISSENWAELLGSEHFSICESYSQQTLSYLLSHHIGLFELTR